MVLADCTSMKRSGVNSAATTVSGKELRECGVEIIGNEGGNDVLFIIWNDKEVASAHGIEVVLPPRTWVDAWLRTTRAWGASFGISVHSCSFQNICLSLLVQYHSHG